MASEIRALEESWEYIVDDAVPGLQRYEVSNLGRVRNPKGRVIKPTASSVRRGKPRVRLFAGKHRYCRSIRALVARAFTPTHAELAVLAVTGGLDELLVVREDLQEKLSEIDAFIGILAFGGDAPKVPTLDGNRSLRQFAIQEAAELGVAIRCFVDADPKTDMTRAEKVSRLARLRASYGPDIDQASKIPYDELRTLCAAH